MPSEVVNMEQDLQDAERTIHRAERLITDAIMKDLLENNGACIPQEINDARSILMAYWDRKYGLPEENVDA